MTDLLNPPACACGCGQPITDTSPSAWWATSNCYQTWAARQAGIAADAITDLTLKDDHDPWADVFNRAMIQGV